MAPYLKIRRFEPADQARVVQLHVMGLEQFGINVPHGDWDADLDDIEGEYFGSGGEFLVGEVDGEVVAIGGFRRKNGTTAELKRMRVHTDHQGRGYGQALLDELTARARAFGYSKMWLDTTVKMVPAQKLYTKNGFFEVARGMRGGVEIIFYEKLLDAPGPSLGPDFEKP